MAYVFLGIIVALSTHRSIYMLLDIMVALSAHIVIYVFFYELLGLLRLLF